MESQKCLFKTLLDMLLESKSSDLTSLIKDCLQRVSVVFVGRHVHICLLNLFKHQKLYFILFSTYHTHHS